MGFNMKAVRDKCSIQIEITNACANECANCSRFVGHHKKPYYMDLETFEKAIDSLEGFPNSIGIMGGEPKKHPEFLEICKLIQKKIPKGKRSLHTTGYKWDQYRSIIRKTFGTQVHRNDHRTLSQKHHPMLLAVEDVVPNHKTVEQLIDACWVDRRWSASINPKGCFFCEIAAAQDILFEGPGGIPIEKGWWDNPPQFFADQRKRYCYRCGASVPFHSVFLEENIDYVSLRNFNRLRKLETPRFLKKRVKLIQDCFSEEKLQKLSREWEPWNHRGKNEKELNCYELYGLFKGFATKYEHICRHKINRLREIGTAMLFPQKMGNSPQVLFTDAAQTGLKPTTENRFRNIYPNRS